MKPKRSFATVASLFSIFLFTVSCASAWGQGAPARFVRGDVDGDGEISITDSVVLLSFLYLGGIEPGCLDAADVDDAQDLNITDPINLLGFLFLGGPPPRPPSAASTVYGPSDCGSDPTADGLGCRTFPGCPQNPGANAPPPP